MLISLSYLCQKYSLHPPGVLHLGANEGQEAEAYATQGIERVVWVEADPAVFSVLARNIVPRRDSVAIRACVSDVDGKKVDFYVASNGGQSSSFLELGTHAQAHPSVKYVGAIPMVTTRVDTLLAKEGISLDLEVGQQGWFLNVDLQGAELLALKGMGDLIYQFDSAYIEVNTKELYKGCPLLNDIDCFLWGAGFTRKEIKMTGSGWGDAFYLREE